MIFQNILSFRSSTSNVPDCSLREEHCKICTLSSRLVSDILPNRTSIAVGAVVSKSWNPSAKLWRKFCGARFCYSGKILFAPSTFEQKRGINFIMHFQQEQNLLFIFITCTMYPNETDSIGNFQNKQFW